MKFKGEYPPEWTREFRDRIRREMGNKCERCGHPHDPDNGYALTVHHLDNNKANLARWNLAVLCQRCHLRIQGKVFLPQFYMLEHSDWFKPHLKGYYASMGVEWNGKSMKPGKDDGSQMKSSSSSVELLS